MSQCKCDLRTKLVGDGCRYCNPQEYIDNLIESLEEQRTWVGLSDEEVWDLWNSHTEQPFPEWFVDFKRAYKVIEAKLKEKNT